MRLLPAVDIREGRAVRLRQGDFARETVYADDPLEAARAWVAAGALALHVVDLDGARSGEPASLGHLRRIAAEAGVPVQYGGGLRSLGAVEAALRAGAQSVILGTAALSDDAFLDAVLARFGDRVAVGLDARAGAVAVSGWTESAGERPEAVARRLAQRGVARIVYTAVDRDGMLDGPDLEALRAVAAATGERTSLVYSGGIGSLAHLRAVAALGLDRLEGVISGKALYEGRFSVAAGQAALERAGVA
jgi:phosphoribosylformimino-5-aminoimidazole carboxamide ribotide isomerase